MFPTNRFALIPNLLSLLIYGAGLISLSHLFNSACFSTDLLHLVFVSAGAVSLGLYGLITALRSEARFRSILENMPVMLDAFDQKGNIIAWNQECERVTGYTAAEVMGNPSIMQQLYPNTHYCQQQTSQWNQKGDDYRNWEWELTCKDGSIRTIAWSNIAAKVPVPGWATWGIGVDVTERKRTEQDLAQANQRFQLAMAAINALVYDWDLEQDRVERSEGSSHLFGFPAEAISANSDWWISRIQPEDLPATLEAFQQALQQDERYSLEYRIRNQQGDYVDVHDQGLILRDATGRPLRVVGSVTDITERKRSEIALKQSEATARARAIELETFMEAVPAAVWIAHDPQCHQVTPNRAAYAMMRRSPNSVMTATPADGQYPFQFKIQQNGQDVVPENLPMQRAGRTGQATSGEFEFVFENGDTCYLYGKAVPVRYESGEIRGVIGAFLDITQRRQIEAALQQSEFMFRTLANTMPQLFWVVQPNGQHEYCNQRWYDYTGLTMTQADGPGIYQIIHAEDQPQTVQAFEAALQTGLMFRIEHRLRRASDGEYRWHLSQALPLYDENNQVRKWFGSSTDIHDQKLLIEERALALDRERAARMALERTSRMKDEFLAVVSHELRSPLNAILGWSRLLRTRTFDPQKQEQALASIERNAQAQTQLIEDLLDISRIIRGKIRLDLRPTNLLPCVQAAVDTIRPTATAKSITISFDATLEDGFISGDPERLQQIVWNLLSNAVKFTPPGGQVGVTVRTTDHLVLIQVADSGRGISPDFLPHVFERFRQEDATTTRTQGGLGLGLAIVRNLVELHGGSIGVSSAGEGQGSAFTVQFPLLSLVAEEPVSLYPGLHRQTVADPLLDLTGVKVLAVDDEGDTREFLRAALEQYGASVISAGAAAEAWQLLQTHKPDVLLSDVGMPDEDGFTLIRRIRSLPPEQGGDIPAAALTAYAREGDRLQALAAGFQMHIPKPIEPIQLLTVISKLIHATKGVRK